MFLIAKRGFHASVAQKKIIPFLLADIGEGITECEVIQWFVKPGDSIQQFSKICEVQSDKAAVEITSRYDGVVKSLNYTVGQVAKVGSSLVEIDVPDSETPVSIPAATPPIAQTIAPVTQIIHQSAPQNSDSWTLATPAVRRVAKENNINLTVITGSGPDGRILKGDVLNFVSKDKPMPSTLPKSITASIPLNTLQKAMFKSMTKSLDIPHFGYSDEIILNSTTDLRNNVNAYLALLENPKVKKVSYMPFFIKALSLALIKFPLLNSLLVNSESVSDAGLVYRNEHNIGIAMDTPNGLVVPNIKNVQEKTILEIAAELKRLQELGSKNSLGVTDLSNGTITLSNIGNIGGTVLHPVLLNGQLCIAGIGKIQRLPRFEMENGVERVVAKQIMNVSFNADHRVIDGATMARFVTCWKGYLENPGSMAVEMR